MFSEQAGRKSLTRTRKAVKQCGVARFKLLSHSPVVEQSVAMQNPMFDLFELFQSIGRQYQMIPCQFSFNEACREFTVVVGFPFYSCNKPVKDIEPVVLVNVQLSIEGKPFSIKLPVARVQVG